MLNATEAEKFEAFEGLNESYIEMERALDARSPRCHMKKMDFHMGESESWWECETCGHVKNIN